MAHARGKVTHECFGLFRPASADEVADNKLGVGIHTDPCPHVASLAALVLRDVLGLRVDEAPNLVRLDALAWQVAHEAVLVDRADRAEINKKLDDRVLGHAGHATRRANAVALNKRGDDLLSLLGRETVHTDYYA